MPVPLGFVEKNGWNIRLATCGGSPVPVSLTETRTCSSAQLAANRQNQPRVSLDLLHRFDAVDEQVHHDLLQLHSISDDKGQVGRQVRPDGDVSNPTASQRRSATISRIVALKSSVSCCGEVFRN